MVEVEVEVVAVAVAVAVVAVAVVAVRRVVVVESRVIAVVGVLELQNQKCKERLPRRRRKLVPRRGRNSPSFEEDEDREDREKNKKRNYIQT